MTNCTSDFRVLSVQSHVVSGYVGNKSACFPLQLLGFEVDIINSVQLSNHTGYKHIKGQLQNADELQELYDGLKLNDLNHYTHVLTGYVGTVTFLTKLVEIVKEMKKSNPDLYVVCDPVMGDNNKLYVPAELLPIYKDDFIPISDLITPNQFEAKLLTGIDIKSQEGAIEAMNVFHSKNVKTVVLTSVQLDVCENLLLFGSSIINGRTIVCMEIPKLDAIFTGTGDLFSALLLGWMARTNGDLVISCERTANSMKCVLERTLNYASATKDPSSPFSLELKLIQSKDDIENPPTTLKCQVL